MQKSTVTVLVLVILTLVLFSGILRGRDGAAGSNATIHGQPYFNGTVAYVVCQRLRFGFGGVQSFR